MRNRGIEHEERKKEEIEIEPRELWKREKVMKAKEKMKGRKKRLEASQANCDREKR